MSANSDLRDRAIRHAIAILNYEEGVADRLVRQLNRADAEIVEKIASRLAAIEERGYDLGPRSTKRLLALLEEIRALNSAIYAQLHDTLVEELHNFAAAEASFQKASLEAALAVEIGTKLPAPARLRAIVEEVPFRGKLLSAWSKGMEQGRIDRVTEAIRDGMIQGDTTDQIVRRIRGTKAAFYSDGILNISRNSAQSIARTAVSHVSNVTAQETWKANSNVVKGWQFLATLDSRTTPDCGRNDGSVHSIGQGPIPPLHIGCRSISVPVTKSFRELGLDRDELDPKTRASMDGQVSAKIPYPEWLKSKSLAFQEDVLGKERARLFNEGELTFKQLVRNDGSFLTLAQLKNKYPNILR